MASEVQLAVFKMKDEKPIYNLSWNGRDWTTSEVEKKISELSEDDCQKVQRFSAYTNLMTEIPRAVLKFPNLSVLFLKGNQFTEIPTWLEQIPKLKALHLYKNNISTIPDVIGKLTNLKTLALDQNNINNVPQCMENLKKLKYLRLNCNSPMRPSYMQRSFYHNDVKIFFSFLSTRNEAYWVMAIHTKRKCMLGRDVGSVIAKTIMKCREET